MSKSVTVPVGEDVKAVRVRATPVQETSSEQKTEKGPAYYCFKCGKPQVIEKAREQVISFESPKAHVPMTRTAIVGECSVCHRRVSHFTKQGHGK